MSLRVAMVAHSDAPWTPLYGAALQERGHVVKIGSFHEAKLAGLDCEFLGTRPFLPGRNRTDYLWGVLRAARLLRSFRPDVVFAPFLSSNGLVACLAWRGPVVVSACGSDVLAVRTWAQRQVVARVCARAVCVHAVSENLVDALVDQRVPRDKIECFPVGVDPDRFASPGVGGQREGHILGVRKHDAVYQNDVIVAALGLLRDRGRAVRGTLLGGGPLLEERRAQVSSLGLEGRVLLPGHVEHERIPEYLASAAIYVSASRSDGASASLLEAMASGCFPVVAGIRANEYWIDSGRTGLLFDVGDPVSLANALEKALDDDDLRREAATLNRARVVREAKHSEMMDRLDGLLRAVALKAP